MAKHVIVGTAGHIDHGKSALVEALTGTHPDRLEEEKRRGITIDLGYAFLGLGDAQLGFVDVPGHEKFVRNMLAGAGGIDVVLLVVAADESIKPQTREHFEICRLLGVERGLVVITKTDLVDAEALGLVKLEVEEFVQASFLEGAPIVAVSARTGAGLDELKRELLRVAQAAPQRDASHYARLPVDRAFVMPGFGTVATGTLISGTLTAEQPVELFPVGKRSRVRGLHSGGRAVAQASAGQRTAVNLADIDLAEIERGMVLATAGVFRSTSRLDARISLLPSARPPKARSRVHFHCGAAERIAEVALLDKDQLAPGTTALAQVRLDAPTLVLPGDRFIIRQFSPVVTIGGGIVLDALAKRHKHRDTAVIQFLATLENGSSDEALRAMIAADAHGVDMAQLISRTGWLESKLRGAAQKLAEAKKIQVVSEQPWVAISSEAMEAFLLAMEREVNDFHAANPLAPGIAKQELRGRIAPRLRTEVFRAALEELVRRGKIAVMGDTVQRAKREIALSEQESKAKEQIAREFERAGLAAPAVSEVLSRVAVDATRGQKLLQMLIREKTLVKVTEEMVFHRAALVELSTLLAGYKRAHGERLPIAAFKELAGVTRKHAIPLLEYMDRIRLTRRSGDERVIL
ncbi:MAG: selenocysteine-specific translation elongation factor [Candidatus Acidiferrales bacterium]